MDDILIKVLDVEKGLCLYENDGKRLRINFGSEDKLFLFIAKALDLGRAVAEIDGAPDLAETQQSETLDEGEDKADEWE